MDDEEKFFFLTQEIQRNKSVLWNEWVWYCKIMREKPQWALNILQQVSQKQQ